MLFRSIQLLAHEKGVENHVDDSLSIGDNELPSIGLAEWNAQERPRKEGDNNREVDKLRTRGFNNLVEPAIQNPSLGNDTVGINVLHRDIETLILVTWLRVEDSLGRCRAFDSTSNTWGSKDPVYSFHPGDSKADSRLNCKKIRGLREWYGAFGDAETTGRPNSEYTVLHMMLVGRKMKDQNCTELDEI